MRTTHLWERQILNALDLQESRFTPSFHPKKEVHRVSLIPPLTGVNLERTLAFGRYLKNGLRGSCNTEFEPESREREMSE